MVRSAVWVVVGGRLEVVPDRIHQRNPTMGMELTITMFNSTNWHFQQRMQAAQDQMQWKYTLPTMWKPQSRLPVCAELLHEWLQGVRGVPPDECASCTAPGTSG